MTPIRSTSVVVARAGVLDAAIGAEIVVLGPDNSRYHGLDPIGARVWALLDGDRSVAEICGVLSEEFEVDPDQCALDVAGFLADLAEHELVDVR